METPLLPWMVLVLVVAVGGRQDNVADVSRIGYAFERNFLAEGQAIQGKQQSLELSFIVDGSSVMGEKAFSNALEFIKRILPYFSVSLSTTRVSLTTYSSTVRTVFGFRAFDNRDCVVKSIDAASYDGGEANLADGLENIVRLLTKEASAWRSNSRRLVLLLANVAMDTRDDPITAAEQLKFELNATIFVIGVGLHSADTILKNIASSPAENYFHWLEDSISLAKVVGRSRHLVQHSACDCGESTIVYDECHRRCACQNGTVSSCCRVRKEFLSMSEDERTRFVSAFKIISTQEPHKTRYDHAINMHQEIFNSGVHEKSLFLPWHRWYLLELENMLQEIDCRITMPYWSWSLWSLDPWNTNHLWSSTAYGLGSNGGNADQCVMTGEFSQAIGNWSLPTGDCLKRNFDGLPPNEEAVSITLDLMDFDDFELNLRANLHDIIHCLIDGTMCSLHAASAPEFFLHHAYVDSLWNDWQRQSEANKNAYFPSVSGLMVRTKYERGHFIDLDKQPGCVAVSYDKPVVTIIEDAESTFQDFQGMFQEDADARNRPESTRFSKARNLFKLTPEEKKKAVNLAKLMRGIVDKDTKKIKLKSRNRKNQRRGLTPTTGSPHIASHTIQLQQNDTDDDDHIAPKIDALNLKGTGAHEGHL